MYMYTILSAKISEEARQISKTDSYLYLDSVFQTIHPRKAKEDIRASPDLLALKAFRVKC